MTDDLDPIRGVFWAAGVGILLLIGFIVLSVFGVFG